MGKMLIIKGATYTPPTSVDPTDPSPDVPVVEPGYLTPTYVYYFNQANATNYLTLDEFTPHTQLNRVKVAFNFSAGAYSKVSVKFSKLTNCKFCLRFHASQYSGDTGVQNPALNLDSLFDYLNGEWFSATEDMEFDVPATAQSLFIQVGYNNAAQTDYISEALAAEIVAVFPELVLAS